MENPYFQTQNGNLTHISVPNDGIKDFAPSDGWELIARDFGWTNDGIPLSRDRFHIILYNRHRGILRIFVTRTGDQLLNGARIRLRFANNSASIPSTLDYAENQQALNDFIFDKRTTDNLPLLNQVTPFIVSPLIWFYADFPMAYDPCTCFYQSLMNVEIQLYTTQTITMNGNISGNITSDQNSMQYGHGTKNLADTRYGKAVKAFKTIDAFKTKSDQVTNNINITGKNNIITGINNLSTEMKKNSFLKTGLQFIPYLDAAISIWDAFIGGGKSGPQQVELTPLSVNLSTSLSGTINTNYTHQGVVFRTPGSLYQNASNDVYPFYNQTLGVINLLRRPRVRIAQFLRPNTGSTSWVRESYIKLNEPLQFVLNPAAGVEIVEIRGSYISNFIDDLSGGFGSVTVRPERNDNFGTSYLDVRNLTNTIIVSRTTSFNEGLYFWSSMQMRFMIHLRIRNASANTQDILLVQTYPVTYDIIRLNTITELNAFRTTSAAPSYTATDAQITTFCNGSEYRTPQRGLAFTSDYERAVKKMHEFEKRLVQKTTTNPNNSNDNNLTVYPNPLISSSTIVYTLRDKGKVKIDLVDPQGVLIKPLLDVANQQSGTHTLSLEKHHLSSGVYFVRMNSGSGRLIMKKIIIAK